MSNFGFVYVLGNKAMPGLFKVGCTERSPFERARQLSKATGVPHPFEVYFHIEVEDHQYVERLIHARLNGCRSNQCREFFTDLKSIVAHLYYYPDRLAFSDPFIGENGDGVIEAVNGDDFRPYDRLQDLINPWEPLAGQAESIEMEKHLHLESVAYRAALRGQLLDAKRRLMGVARSDDEF